jgi:hypothetical protein
MRMFTQVLRAQWHQARALVVLFALLAFAVPLVTVMYGGGLRTEPAFRVSWWLTTSANVGAALPVIALALGVLLGMVTWSADQAGRHVYAMALPLPRWRFVLLRFGAGMVLLAVPVAALLVGGLIATAAVKLPDGIHAYPVALTARFGLSAFVCFAIFFAISTATRRAALITLGGIVGLTVADLLLTAFEQEAVVVEWAFQILTTWPGPLAILIGRWALFDV